MLDVVEELFQQGVELHKSGKVEVACQLYTAVLKAHPEHPTANHNMGVLAVNVGKVQEALPFFEAALEANADTAQFWLSYIDALINVERIADAQAVFDQAKKNGAQGDGFDQLEQRLNVPGQEPLESSVTASKAHQDQPNILSTLRLDQALRLAKRKSNEGSAEEAKRIYQDILMKFPKNKRAIDGLKGLSGRPVGKASKVQEPPQDQQQSIINLYSQGQLQQALEQAEVLMQQFPNSSFLYNICGAVYKELGQLDASVEAYNKAIVIAPHDAEVYSNMGNALKEQGKLEEAIEAYNKALAIKPDYAEACYNMGNALQDQGKLEEAIGAYNKALAIKPDNAEAYGNMGATLQDQGKLKEAIEAYKKALAIEPDNAEVYSNMGNVLQEQGKLKEAIEAYNKALAIKPNFAEAYNNMGNALQDQGKLEEALEAYNKALTIKPDYAEAHRHLSTLTKYTSDGGQISVVDDLLQRPNLDYSDRSNLHYTYAKIKEDLGDLSAAFGSYVAGGALRKKLLAYEFAQDQNLFSKIKNTAAQFKDISLNVTGEPIRHTPIFILGMPRSGTTLVEQIVSSHSEITGAGELAYVSQFGGRLAAGLTAPTLEAVSVFRERYLAELAKRADGQVFITDKMPQNFRYIALICAAFPEAKIVHVKRNAEATCWSNFKHFFVSKDLGYSYNLADTVRYYGLYNELMHFWYQSYSDRIYNLNYDKLTEDQEPQTLRLIEYLELNWEDACLAPQNNKRSVKTSSQQQVRQKVYKGSSQAWCKYEPFLNGVFDGLKV